MAKKKEHAEWIITKGQRSRWQKEQKRRRIILIIASVVIAIVMVFVIYGIYDSEVAPYHKTVLKVNDKSFDMNNYIDAIQLQLALADLTGANSDNSVLATQALSQLETSEIRQQLAKAMDITVSEEEIDETIRNLIMPPDSDDNDEQPDITYEEQLKSFLEFLDAHNVTEQEYREQIGIDLQWQVVREEIGKTQVPEETAQAHLLGILYETVVETGTPNGTAPPANSGTPSVTETPTISGSPAASHVTETIDPMEIRDEIASRLDTGDDFASLYDEYSLPIGKEGGDLEWGPAEVIELYYGGTVSQVAFDIDLGTLSEPIRYTNSENETKYWAIQVIERENSRPLDDDIRSIAENIAFNDWFNEELEKFEVKKDYLDDDDIEWAIEEAL